MIKTVTCPFCQGEVYDDPYDIGSGPELSCPHCEMCWGRNGQPLKPLNTSRELLAGLRRAAGMTQEPDLTVGIDFQ